MTKFYDETETLPTCEHCYATETGECTCHKCQSCFECQECRGNSQDFDFCDECIAEGVLEDEEEEEEEYEDGEE